MEKNEKTSRLISDTTLDRYLSAILSLRRSLPLVRSVDVAGHLGCSKACVSMAVKQMTREELVSIGRHGALELTAAGERRAISHRNRCDYFRGLLVQSGVEAASADAEAAAITRALSGQSFEALCRYLSQRGVPAPEHGSEGVASGQ